MHAKPYTKKEFENTLKKVPSVLIFKNESAVKVKTSRILSLSLERKVPILKPIKNIKVSVIKHQLFFKNRNTELRCFKFNTVPLRMAVSPFLIIYKIICKERTRYAITIFSYRTVKNHKI